MANCLLGMEKRPTFIEFIVSHYEDTYEPASILECNKGLYRGSCIIYIRM